MASKYNISNSKFSMNLNIDIYQSLANLPITAFHEFQRSNNEKVIPINQYWLDYNSINYDSFPKNVASEGNLLYTNKGSHGYLYVYHELFNTLRNYRLNLVELGIGATSDSGMRAFNEGINTHHGLRYSFGGSLYFWQRYFPNANISGWDIDCSKIKENYPFKLFSVDSLKQDELTKAIELTNNYLRNNTSDSSKIDIFIDDGCHYFSSQLNSVMAIFPHISKGGIYIIEDVEPDMILKDGQTAAPTKVGHLNRLYETIIGSLDAKCLSIQICRGEANLLSSLIILQKN